MASSKRKAQRLFETENYIETINTYHIALLRHGYTADQANEMIPVLSGLTEKMALRKFNSYLNKCVYHGVIIPELLINGNDKIGKGVFHWSTTAGLCGTCFLNCPGCYGMAGRYLFENVKESLARKTDIVRNDLAWFVYEINREIKKHNIKYLRIHVTGDFFNADYVNAWIEIVSNNPDCRFWTYTKAYGHGFDDRIHELNSLPNCNIVESLIPGCGFNYGHCDYLLDTYYKLLSEGKKPYICPCGVNDHQHCNDCTGCSTHKHVLFIEHGTDYDAKKDSLYSTVADLINKQ